MEEFPEERPDEAKLEHDADYLVEIERRLAAYDANPKDVCTWEDIVAYVKRPRGRATDRV